MGMWNGTELSELTLHSERLTLRRWRPDDAGAVLAAASTDAPMAEFLPIPQPYTPADAAHFVADIGHEGRDDGTGLGCALVETSTGRVVGGAGIRLPAERHGRCHLGYSVYPGARGNGYAAEAADALARWGFAHGVVRVELQASVRNIASIRSALRVGFRFEGVERQAIAVRGELQDAALFARVAADPGAPIAPALAPIPEAGLSDGVIRLRVADVSDAQAAFEEVTDPVSEQWAFNDTRAELSAVTATAEAARLHWLVGPVGRMTIVDVATEAPAGSMQVRLSGPPNVGGIGYGVHPAFRGRGYTTRALRLFIAWAFGAGGFTRLELGAKVANVASQKAALHAGFEPDGVRAARLRNPDGSFSDETRFALTNPASRRAG